MYPRAWESFPFSDVFFAFFHKDLMFLSHRFFTYLVTVMPQYFMLFVAIVKGDVSLISFLTSLSSIYSMAINFFELI